ncbi:MAG: YceI family protein [Actinomycetia bacterium]|nr:YceI family protein [Actinomycetes bacterium]
MSAVVVGVVGVLVCLAACGGAGEEAAPPVSAPAPSPVASAPLVEASPSPAEGSGAAQPSAPVAPPSAAVSVPAGSPGGGAGFDEDRRVGELDGVAFLVAEGSEVTFTVQEQLTRLPLPNDAVMRTTALEGEVYLDGRPAAVSVDLHTLVSDQSGRDRCVRRQLFAEHPTATFAIDGVPSFPEGFAGGEEVSTRLEGTLLIRGVAVPMAFDVTARDDGDVVYLLGRSTFTWSDFDMTAPRARVVVWVADEVRVEVLLALRPLPA